MVNKSAQQWLEEKYNNKNQVEKIELEAGTLIIGQLQIEDFPRLKRINVKGSWSDWGKLTGIVVKKCPNLVELNCSYNEIKEFAIADCSQLQNFDYSRNNQWEELAKFDGSKLEYNVVSYIGSLDSDLYEQLKTGLPALDRKHERLQRLCLGCLTKGGHQNNSAYNYHAEVRLTKGGEIEYGVTANGNKRQTCEIPEEGGLLMVNINSTENGTLKIKRSEVKNVKKLSEEDEKEKFQKTLALLEEELKNSINEQHKSQLEEGKASLEKKLLEVENQLVESEKKRRELQNKYDELKQTLSGKQEKIAKLKQVKMADQERFESQVEELEKELTENEKKILQKLKELFSTFNNQLDSKNIVELEKALQDYKEADFTNTPHLPDIFRLGKKGLSDYLDSSIQHYHEWQRAREEAEKLRTNIKQKEIKNAEKIVKLSQKIEELQSQNQFQQRTEVANLQEKLKLAQDYAKELKNTLKITVQTLEKGVQTDLTSEDINQKDLKIEEYRQKSIKQKRLSINTTPQQNPNLEGDDWTKAVREQEGSITPSQILARERERRQSQVLQSPKSPFLKKNN